jgi:hypothetical protein
MSLTPDDLPPADEEEVSDERLPLTDLDTISNRPPSRRKRGVQMALLALACCVAVALVWSTIRPGSRQTAQPNATLTPIPALLVSNLSNATITLNGKELSGKLPQVVSAYLETNEITIAAPLFRPHTCHFKRFEATGDDAHCLFTTHNSAPNGPAFVFGIFLTPDDLLPTQQQQTLAPLMQELAAAQQATLLPGDYFATAFANTAEAISSQRARTALQASASFVQARPLDPSTSPFAAPFTPACAQLICPTGFDSSASAAPAGQVWNLLLNVALRWRFTDDTGAAIADVTYQPGTFRAFWPVPVVQFVYNGTGWHLSADTDLSQAMQATLCGYGTTILEHRVPPGGYRSMGLISNRGVQGCLISVQGTARGDGTFLWRFGVLLAADAGARAVLPDLPIAPKAEIAAVNK